MPRFRLLLLALCLSACATPPADTQTPAGALRGGAGLLAWAPDRGGPRVMAPSTREELTDSLLRGEREQAFAAQSGQTAGLRDLFAEAALADAQAVAAHGAPPVSWGHRVTLHFFAPDGATVSLTDRFWYLIPDGPGALRVAAREQDQVLQLDDGNWRTHHWRVVRDDALPPPAPPGPAPLFRAARLSAAARPWTDRSADRWRRDLRAVRELGLDTLILPLDLRPGAPETALTPAVLARVGEQARALNVALLLEVTVEGLSPRALRALHGALGAGARPPALAGVLLRPEGRPAGPTVTLWRQTLQARFGPLPLGLVTASPAADFSLAGVASVQARRWPLGLLHGPRRTWQLRAFVRAHPQGSLLAGHLYGAGGLLTPDGSFTPLARALTRPAERPGGVAFVWGWALDLWPLLLVVVGGWWVRRTRSRR